MLLMELKLKGDYFVAMFTKENGETDTHFPRVERSDGTREDEQEIKTVRDSDRMLKVKRN